MLTGEVTPFALRVTPQLLFSVAVHQGAQIGGETDDVFKGQGQTAGLVAWRIENFVPVPVPEVAL